VGPAQQPQTPLGGAAEYLAAIELGQTEHRAFAIGENGPVLLAADHRNSAMRNLTVDIDYQHRLQRGSLDMTAQAR